MQLSVRYKRILTYAGLFIALLSIVYVIDKFLEHVSVLDFGRVAASDLIWLPFLLAIYTSSILFQVFGWHSILKNFHILVRLDWSFRVFGITQLGRYIPGNIFQFAGRQTVGMSAGLPAWPLAKTMVWELFLFSLSGVLFLPTLFLEDSELQQQVSLLIAYILLFSSVLFILIKKVSRWIAYAFIAYTVYLVISAAIFSIIVFLIKHDVNYDFSFVLYMSGVYIVAWLAGLITPGAPAGIGVRELIIIMLLGSVVNEVELLFSVALMRLLTLAGDFLFFLLAFAASIVGKKACGNNDPFV